MSGWCYNMNNKSLVVIAHRIFAEHVVFIGNYIVVNELPDFFGQNNYVLPTVILY